MVIYRISSFSENFFSNFRRVGIQCVALLFPPEVTEEVSIYHNNSE